MRPTREEIDAAVKQSINSVADAQERWDSSRSRGQTDSGLTDAVQYEVGQGGFAGPDGYYVEYHGGRLEVTLKKWPGWEEDDEPFIISGKALLDTVRRIEEVPVPGVGLQQELV